MNCPSPVPGLPHLVIKLGGCSGILYSLRWPGHGGVTILSHLPHNKFSSLRRPGPTQEVTRRKVPAGPVRCGRGWWRESSICERFGAPLGRGAVRRALVSEKGAGSYSLGIAECPIAPVLTNNDPGP